MSIVTVQREFKSMTSDLKLSNREARKLLAEARKGGVTANEFKMAPTRDLSNTTAAIRNGGGCVDTGNNISLLDDPMELIEGLAPYAISTHIKDMGVEPWKDGFLLSELPLELRKKYRNKRERHGVQVELALEDWDEWLNRIDKKIAAKV